jgi:hypothetical protein
MENPRVSGEIFLAPGIIFGDKTNVFFLKMLCAIFGGEISLGI